MAVKNILKMGNSIIQGTAQEVIEFNTSALDNLINDMFDTMITNQGAGIAAPQIGVPLRVIVFGFEHAKRYPHAAPIPKTILINPRFELINDDINEDWEGCLSVRGIRGLVPRYTRLRYSGYDNLGNFFTRNVEGFHARMIQHEIDHLNGLVFPQRIKDLKYFGFEEEIVELMKVIGSKLQ